MRDAGESQSGDARAAAASAAGSGAWAARVRSWRDVALAIAIVLALAWAATFAALTVRKHQSFHSNAYDLGLQQHVVWNTAHGRWFEYTYMVAFNPRLTNHLGDHVNLILLPIAALILFMMGRRRCWWSTRSPSPRGWYRCSWSPAGASGATVRRSRWRASTSSTRGLQAALLFDFHPIVLAAPLFLWCYLFAITRRDRWLVAASVLLLATQENAALVVALLGVVVAIAGRRHAGTALFAAGLAWFVVCFFAILPALNPGVGSNAFARYRHLGASWSEVGSRVLLPPSLLPDRRSTRAVRAYLRALLLPFGCLSLLAPEILVCAASEAALNLLSDFPGQRTIDYQYASVTVAVAALAAVVGAGRAVRFACARFGMTSVISAWSRAPRPPDARAHSGGRARLGAGNHRPAPEPAAARLRVPDDRGCRMGRARSPGQHVSRAPDAAVPIDRRRILSRVRAPPDGER